MIEHDYIAQDENIKRNELRTLMVICLTAVTMIIEIFAGYITSSMALLADGWHMASHVGALAISYAVYRLARVEKVQGHFSFGTGKFLPLGGFTSSILLAVVACIMVGESLYRFVHPQDIMYKEAMIVAIIGLIVNLLSAYLLGHHDHHKQHDDHDHRDCEHHHEHDHNIRGAYLHVLADALTSIFAIIALALGSFYQMNWADALIGVVGGLVILKWSYGLAKDTAWELLDGYPKGIDAKVLGQWIEENWGELIDYHLWKIAPNIYSLSVIIRVKKTRSGESYRQQLLEKFDIKHCTIEEELV